MRQCDNLVMWECVEIQHAVYVQYFNCLVIRVFNPCHPRSN